MNAIENTEIIMNEEVVVQKTVKPKPIKEKYAKFIRFGVYLMQSFNISQDNVICHMIDEEKWYEHLHLFGSVKEQEEFVESYFKDTEKGLKKEIAVLVKNEKKKNMPEVEKAAKPKRQYRKKPKDVSDEGSENNEQPKPKRKYNKKPKVVPQEVDVVFQEIDVVSQEVDEIPEELDEVPQEIDVVPQELDVVFQEVEVVPEELDEVSQEVEVVPQEVEVVPEKGKANKNKKTAEPTNDEKPKKGSKSSTKKEKAEKEKAEAEKKKAEKEKAEKEKAEKEKAEKEKAEKEKALALSEEEDEDEESLDVEEIVINGKNYYIDDDGTVYDYDTHEDLGNYTEFIAEL
jgi:hypothetical protein